VASQGDDVKVDLTAGTNLNLLKN